MKLKAKVSQRDRKDRDDALKEAIREESVRLNAEIPQSLHKKIKVYAAMQEKSITNIVIDALNDYMSKNKFE